MSAPSIVNFYPSPRHLCRNYLSYVTLQGASWVTEEGAWSYFYLGVSFKFSSSYPTCSVRQSIAMLGTTQLLWLACVCAQLLQLCRILCDPMTAGHLASLSMGFSRQEYWSGLQCPPPGDLPDPRDWTWVSWGSCIAGGFFATEPLGKPC